MKRKTKKILYVTFLLTAIVTLFILITSNYLYGIAILADKDKTAFFKGLDAQEYDHAFAFDDFFSLIEYNDIYINADDGLKLHAYEFCKHTNQWVIVVHGYMGEGKDMSYQAHQFYDMGYNVLAVDLRGHGSSEGNYIGMGWIDRIDIVNWIHYLVKTDPNSEIILYGVSMGASTVMNTAGEKLPHNVKGVIEDCGFTSVWEILKYQMKDMFKLPAFPLLYTTDLITQFRSGYSFHTADTKKQLKKATIPILFIHGDKDSFVPFSMLNELYNSAHGPKEKLVIHNAMHGVSSQVDPLTYWQTVKRFLKPLVSSP